MSVNNAVVSGSIAANAINDGSTVTPEEMTTPQPTVVSQSAVCSSSIPTTAPGGLVTVKIEVQGTLNPTSSHPVPESVAARLSDWAAKGPRLPDADEALEATRSWSSC